MSLKITSKKEHFESIFVCVCVCAHLFSCIQLFVTH